MKAICKNFPHTMIFLGPSGSGKDTQADLLSKLCGYEVIGTGAMFRAEYEKKTKEGIEAYRYWGKGKWVPDELVYRLFRNWIKQYDPQKQWIFIQVVRTSPQVKLFEDFLKEYDRKLDKAIYFQLSDEAAIERMSLRRYCPKCGRDYHLKYKKPKNDEVCDDDGIKLVIRDDDNPKSIKQRINEFRIKTEPLLEIYKKRGIMVEVNADPSIKEIHKTLVKMFSNEG